VAAKLPKPLLKVDKDQKPATDGGSKTTDKSKQKTPADQSADRALLDEAIKGISERKSEKEIAHLVLKISDESLEDAIAKADAAAKEIADKGKKAENVLEQLDLLVDQLAYTTRKFLRTCDSLHDGNDFSFLVRRQIDELVTDYKSSCMRSTYTSVAPGPTGTWNAARTSCTRCWWPRWAWSSPARPWR
jgi:hypothetical protein